MSWLKSVCSKFIGLFVDDGSLAVAVLLWLGASWLLVPRLLQSVALPPIVLFAGLASILLESTLRRARRKS